LHNYYESAFNLVWPSPHLAFSPTSIPGGMHIPPRDEGPICRLPPYRSHRSLAAAATLKVWVYQPPLLVLQGLVASNWDRIGTLALPSAIVGYTYNPLMAFWFTAHHWR